MATASQVPTFNLKVVLQETGLKPDTLRAWERRYGLPQPERTSGGHRLYSQRDIEIIKWLMARQQAGLSISRAVDLWRGLESEGQDPLQMAEYAVTGVPGAAVSLPAGEAIAELRQAWTAACLAYEERTAEQVLTQAFALYPVEVVCLELLQKGLAELGKGWYQGEVTVQQEHFASALTMRRLDALIAATPPPTRPDRILIGCPPQEEHTFSPRLLTLFLRRRGWDVLYLGANVPVARLGSAIDAARPRLIIMAAQQLHTAASLLEVARYLKDYGIPLAFGGVVFNHLPEMRARIPGHFLGERLDRAHQVVEELLSSAPPLPPVEAVSEDYRQALIHYRERQAQIEAQIWQMMEPMGMPYDHMTAANAHFGINVGAALALGDMGYLGVDIEWVEGLLSNFGQPDDLLRRYLCVYHEAAKTHLDERGAPLIEWLERLTLENSDF